MSLSRSSTPASPQTHYFGVTRRKVDVKLRPNFTSKRAFLEAKKQAFFMRRMLIIRHKHSQVGWWGVRKNSVKLKKQVLMEFGGWSLPPWPKSLICNRFPYSYRRAFRRRLFHASTRVSCTRSSAWVTFRHSPSPCAGCPATITNGWRRQLKLTPGDNYQLVLFSGGRNR